VPRLPLLLGAALASATLAAPAAAADPRLLESQRLSTRSEQLSLRTSELAAPTTVRVLLPSGYRSGRRRYPVLYLLHGAGGDHRAWTSPPGRGDAERLTAGLPLIVVMPDGGRGGFYTDWFNNGAFGRPRWESWHIGRLIGFVDRRYRTVAARRGRAIAGLSMGGFGALSYASRHPDLFTAAASFSGAVDPTLAPGVIDAIAGSDGGSPGSLWGAFEAEEVRWRAHNPLDLAENLRGLGLWLRTGNGQPGGPFPGGPSVDGIEAGVGVMAQRVHARLRQLRIAHVFDAYGAGQHLWPYWNRGLEQTLPGLMARFRRAPRPPAEVTYRSAERRYSVYGWSVRIARRAMEFSRLAEARPGGFTLSGSGKASVTTPRVYRAGRRYRIVVRNGGGARSLAGRPDRRGRLRIDVPLGPSNARQQYRPGARTRVFTTRVRVAR
jgi:S-formylglutathione hydrolase FrmB